MRRREPQVAVGGTTGFVERFEDPVELLGRDGGAVVMDGQHHVTVAKTRRARAGRHRELAAGSHPIA